MERLIDIDVAVTSLARKGYLMSAQEASLPKFTHEDRIRMHYQRKQIRENAKIYTKRNFLRLVPYALFYALPVFLTYLVNLSPLNTIETTILGFTIALLLYPLSRIGVANAILRLWNEQRLQGADLLIAVSTPKRYAKAILLCFAESGLAWLISFFPGAWLIIPTLAAQVFAVFFSFVPFLFSRNPEARAIDLIKESFRRMYRFFWQWYGVVIRASKWIIISAPILLVLSMFGIYLYTGETMLAGYLYLAMLFTYIPIVPLCVPYYLLATTGFVNDQVLTAGQPNPQVEDASQSN